MKKNIIIPCDCGGHHYLEVIKWDDETDYWICLISADNSVGFWERIKEAFKYVFQIGFQRGYHDVVIEREQMNELKEYFKNI